jgi:hypothetical protein
MGKTNDRKKVQGATMSEVEKMYENANVKKDWNSTPYGGIEEYYPPFTAEKQLELIKKLGNINIDIDNGCYMSSEILEVEAHCDTFEETLAEFVNNLWQDLTEAERKQIKEMLE